MGRLPATRKYIGEPGETATKAHDTADDADDEANQAGVVLALVVAGEECARQAVGVLFFCVFFLGGGGPKAQGDTSRLVSHSTMV